MSAKRIPQNTWVLIAGGITAILLVGIVVTLDPLATPLTLVIRAAAILGYLAVYLASLSSIYMRELTQFFGRPFIKVHHIIAVTGLIMLTLHASGIAWDYQSLRIFLPRFDSLITFLELGGRAAFWLIAIASLTALFRSSVGKNWKVIHWLNYIAFLLGTVHAQLIGLNFQHLGVRIVSGLMAISLVGTFFWKRTQKRRLQRKIAARKQDQATEN